MSLGITPRSLRRLPVVDQVTLCRRKKLLPEGIADRKSLDRRAHSRHSAVVVAWSFLGDWTVHHRVLRLIPFGVDSSTFRSRKSSVRNAPPKKTSKRSMRFADRRIRTKSIARFLSHATGTWSEVFCRERTEKSAKIFDFLTILKGIGQSFIPPNHQID